ncbi:MAG: C40 family peptidase, partial [Clostridiales bacterium]|nr:C40 family peptidase [Clostridiales bacterium]
TTTPPNMGTPKPTQTPPNTEAPEPTETQEPPQTSTTPVETTNTDTLLRCTASSLNVRKGAGTSYAIVDTLDKGDMVMPVSKADGWYEIQYLGGIAYVSASYVEEATFDKANDKIEQVIAEGKKLLGIPYVYGAQRYHFGNGSLNSAYDGKSYDCSSLMQYIFKIGANVNLAMTSREQSLQGKEIARQDIRRGDLLFFTNASRFNNTGLERIGHVALYLGDNMILHTASDHAVIEPISATRSSYFITARRLID